MAGLLSTHDIHASGTVATGAVARGPLIRMMMRLKWTLWKRSFRKNVGKIIGTVIGVLYGIGGLATLTMLLGGLVLGVGEDAALLTEILGGLGALVVLTWTLVPLLAFGVDDTLDPRLFATLPRRARELQPGMFAASVISLPSLFTVAGLGIAVVCEAIWMLGSGAVTLGWGITGLVALLPMTIAMYVTCLLLPRAIAAQSATGSGSRRMRELKQILSLVGFIAAMYGMSLFMQSLGDGTDVARVAAVSRTAVDVLAWTPFGAAVSAPLDLATGHVLPALAKIAIALATIAVLWLWWRRSIGLALRSALLGDAASGATKVTALVPRFMRSNALGASVGRSLRYWRRDSRYLGAILIMPIMLVFFVAMGLMNQHTSFMPILGLVLVTAMSGVSLANELGFDGPAGWVTLTAGLDGRTNLLARVIAMATFAVPFVLVASIALPLILGQGRLIPVLVPGCLGAMLGAWGVSILLATLVPYPAPAPGANPMKQRSGGSANAMIASFGAMFGLWVPQIPALILVGVGLGLESMTLQIIGGVVALVCGAIALVVCVRIAGGILDRRYVDLFQNVRSFTT